MLFAPGAPREAYFEGFAQLADLSDEERAEWFIKNDNFFVGVTRDSRHAERCAVVIRCARLLSDQ